MPRHRERPRVEGLRRVDLRDLRQFGRWARGKAQFDGVPLEWTPCRFGGARAWFRCPSCARRCLVTFVKPGEQSSCRLCTGAAYQTQLEGRLDRAYGRRDAILKRLGATPPTFRAVFIKPKGMHWSTFDRLRAQAHVAERAALGLGLFAVCGRTLQDLEEDL